MSKRADHIRRDRIEQRLQALVRVPSLTGDESDAIALVASWLRALPGVEVDHWVASMNHLQEDPAYPGREVEREAVPVVAARIRGKKPGRSLMLTGHVDVVPVGDRAQWRHDPFGADIVGDRLYGRGACDMKAGVIAALEVFEAFARQPPSAGELLFVAVPGEEDGGTGTLAAIRRGWTADATIVTEPTHTEKAGEPTIIIAHGGAITLTLEVGGKSAHACKRLEGHSALEHYIHLHHALRQDEKRLNDAEVHPLMRELGLPYPTCVGRIEGGTWSSSVMDALRAELRVGVSLTESVEEAEARVQQAIAQAAEQHAFLSHHPPRMERTGAAFASAVLDSEHELVQTLSDAAHQITGQRPLLAGAPYGCDMAAWLYVAGSPTVVYGPGDVRLAHAPDEWVSLRETERCAHVLLRAARLMMYPHPEIFRSPV